MTNTTATGENGIITQAQESKDKTIQAKIEEIVDLAIEALITENSGNTDGIIPKDIADKINEEYVEYENVYAKDENNFPTKIIFPEEGNREVEVNMELGILEPIKDDVYNEEGLEQEAEKNIELFLYEEIEGTGEVGTTKIDNLPTKEARIIGMNPKYCNGAKYETETGETYENTNYEIILDDGTKISDTLVIPYQVSGKYIDGADENEMYRITEVNLYVKSYRL